MNEFDQLVNLVRKYQPDANPARLGFDGLLNILEENIEGRQQTIDENDNLIEKLRQMLGISPHDLLKLHEEVNPIS